MDTYRGKSQLSDQIHAEARGGLDSAEISQSTSAGGLNIWACGQRTCTVQRFQRTDRDATLTSSAATANISARDWQADMAHKNPTEYNTAL